LHYDLHKGFGTGSKTGQHPHMGFHAAGQRLQVVASLQAGHDTALGMARGDVFELLGDPGIVVFDQAHLAQVVFPVGIKTGADQQQFRRKGVQRLQPLRADQGANSVPLV